MSVLTAIDGKMAENAAVAEAADLPVVILNDYVEISPSEPLPRLDSPTARAFAAKDLRDGNENNFALICDGNAPLRDNILMKLKSLQSPQILKLLEWGAVDWPEDGHRHKVVLLKKPLGAALMANLGGKIKPMSQAMMVDHVLNPVVSALGQLASIGITHRAIRPDNLYYSDGTRTSVMLGECVSAPPGYNQPMMFETIESSMAMAAGRHAGTPGDDLYALGVTTLILLLGRNPVPHLKDEELLCAKIVQGSYGVLVGKNDVLQSMREPLRGMLCDDPEQRWGYNELQFWLNGRRQGSLRITPPAKAMRAFRFNGNNFFTTRALANALAGKWDTIAASVNSENIATWVDRSLGDEDRTAAVTMAAGKAMEKGGGSLQSSLETARVARLCMALDPDAPIRYKKFSAVFDGLGPALAANFDDQNMVQSIKELLLHELPLFWLTLQTDPSPEHPARIRLAKRLIHYVTRPRLGFGIERCLYELNPTQRCLSPFIKYAGVSEIHELLPAMERAAQPGKRPPMDRHIGAFIATRFAGDVNESLVAIADKRDKTRPTIGLLRLIAVLQSVLGPSSLPRLAQAMAPGIKDIVETYHNEPLRRRLRAKLPKLLEQGNFVEIYNTVADGALRGADAQGFADATQAYAAITVEINHLDRGGGADPVQALQNGRQFAAGLSLFLALVTVAATVMIYK